MEYSMTVRALDSLLKIHLLGLNLDNLAGKEMLILQDTRFYLIFLTELQNNAIVLLLSTMLKEWCKEDAKKMSLVL